MVRCGHRRVYAATVQPSKALVVPLPLLASTAASASSASDESVVFSVAALVVALAACFVFAGTETAITSMGELRVRKLLESGTGPDGWLKLWLKEPSRVLTTLLAGNTLASVAASSIATALTLSLAKRYGLDQDLTDWAVAGAVFLLGGTILIAGEIAPKTLAKMHPEWFLQMMHVVWWFHRGTTWFTNVMIWFAMHIVRALGGKPHTTGMEITEEQIEDMVRIGSEAGSIDENRGDMLQNVFALEETPVRAIMTPRTQMHALSIDATIDEVYNEVQDSHYSRYPVYDRTPDKIVGIFFTKDLLHRRMADKKNFTLGEIMHEVTFVPDSTKASDALKTFQKNSVHLSIVVDEHGGTAGLVTLEDVLEELVGDIYDEYDEPENNIEQVAPDSWTLDAATELREMAETVDCDPPETVTATTVGGFVIEQFGHVPRPGELAEWNGLQFHVVEAEDTHVVRVEIKRLRPNDADVARNAA